jgi:hypothetical protein
MYRIVTICWFWLLSATAVSSQPGSIVPYGDIGRGTCAVTDNGSLVEVYIYHDKARGATASQFKLDVPAAWTHMGDQWQFPTVIGTSITGVSLGYGRCMTWDIYLGVANFIGSNAPECTILPVMPDPLALSGRIEGVDCATPAAKTYPSGGRVIINPNATCGCT